MSGGYFQNKPPSYESLTKDPNQPSGATTYRSNKAKPWSSEELSSSDAQPIAPAHGEAYQPPPGLPSKLVLPPIHQRKTMPPEVFSGVEDATSMRRHCLDKAPSVPALYSISQELLSDCEMFYLNIRADLCYTNVLVTTRAIWRLSAPTGGVTLAVPLNHGARISGCTVWADGKEYAAQVVPTHHAKALKEKQRDGDGVPFQPRFDSNTFKLHLGGAGFPEGTEVEAEFSYLEDAHFYNSQYNISFPLDAYSGNMLATSNSITDLITLTVTVHSVEQRVQIGWSEGIVANSLDGDLDELPRVQTWRIDGPQFGAGEIHVCYSYEISQFEPVGLLSRVAGSLEGCVFLQAPDQGGLPTVGRSFYFVVDISGSMSGVPMDEAMQALACALDTLTPLDEFALMFFNQSNFIWKPLERAQDEFFSASPANIALAKDYLDSVDAQDSTNMAQALQYAASELTKEPNMLPILYLITDGCVDDDVAIVESMKLQCQDVRLMTVGIGPYVNKRFLHTLAEAGRGHCVLPLYAEQIKYEITRLAHMIQTPVLSDIRIVGGFSEFGVFGEVEHFPMRVPDLYADAPLAIAVKGDIRELRVVGQLWNGDRVELVVKMKSTSLPMDRLTARMQVDAMCYQVWLNPHLGRGRAEDLSVKQGVPCDFTTIVCFPREQQTIRPTRRSNQDALPPPPPPFYRKAGRRKKEGRRSTRIMAGLAIGGLAAVVIAVPMFKQFGSPLLTLNNATSFFDGNFSFLEALADAAEALFETLNETMNLDGGDCSCCDCTCDCDGCDNCCTDCTEAAQNCAADGCLPACSDFLTALFNVCNNITDAVCTSTSNLCDGCLGCLDGCGDVCAGCGDACAGCGGGCAC